MEAFIDRIRNVRDQLNPTAERSALLRKMIAAKLKDEAQRVAERNCVTTLSAFS